MYSRLQQVCTLEPLYESYQKEPLYQEPLYQKDTVSSVCFVRVAVGLVFPSLRSDATVSQL